MAHFNLQFFLSFLTLKWVVHFEFYIFIEIHDLKMFQTQIHVWV